MLIKNPILQNTEYELTRLTIEVTDYVWNIINATTSTVTFRSGTAVVKYKRQFDALPSNIKSTINNNCGNLPWVSISKFG